MPCHPPESLLRSRFDQSEGVGERSRHSCILARPPEGALLPAGLCVAVQRAEGASAVVVRGEVDVFSSPVLAQSLRRATESSGDALFADLSETTFIDVSGLRVLAESAARLRKLERGFTVWCGPSRLHRLLEITGLDGIVTVERRSPSLAA